MTESILGPDEEPCRRCAKAVKPGASVAGSISCGQTRTGEIAAAGRQDTSTFRANAGEAVLICAVAASGTLAARAEL